MYVLWVPVSYENKSSIFPRLTLTFGFSEVITLAKVVVGDGEFYPCPNQAKQFPQPPAESSGNSASHSSGNGYKATPIN